LSKCLSVERIGKRNLNTYGSVMEIVEYINKNNIIVKFEDGYKKLTTYDSFMSGKVKSIYNKSVYSIGFIGDGKYSQSINDIVCPQYVSWLSMFRRCYNPKFHRDRPTYTGCTVCDEWHNYQNFAKWFDENYYEANNDVMCLDKDILHKGNKLYSPENCVFVPNTINVLFVKSDSTRGELPIGVSFCKKGNKYRSDCTVQNKQKSLGKFNTKEEAFNTYKKFKEKHIKQIADQYKNLIPQKLYDAMYKYEVEITD